MKVVLFCGGMGMRLRDYSEKIPKPLVEVGPQPIIWHLMKYYAHYGHRDFILCLGYGAGPIKDYFLNYNECRMNNFVYADGGRRIELFATDIEDWTITFVDTGRDSNVGERLRRIEPYLGDDQEFLANYADGLSDLDLAAYVDAFRESNKIARFLTVPPPHTFHNVRTDDDGKVVEIEHISRTNVRVNAGFFAFRREIFEYLRPGEELVVEPFARLIEAGELVAEPFDGYWQPMDTFKDKNLLDQVAAAGPAPWQVWHEPESERSPTSSSRMDDAHESMRSDPAI